MRLCCCVRDCVLVYAGDEWRCVSWAQVGAAAEASKTAMAVARGGSKSEEPSERGWYLSKLPEGR